jgi:hypothetical protein
MADVPFGSLAYPPAPAQVEQPVLPPSALAMILAQAQGGQAPEDNVHTISDGPEYEKWDEALHNHGAIRIPKELDEPQKWLGQDHIQRILKGMGADREDRPDGSVVLRLQQPTS